MRIHPVKILCLLPVFAGACSSPVTQGNLHFTNMPASSTGIDFNNSITEDDSLNMFVNEYTYMGGGVGVGDFNRDGKPDLFFAGNQVSSQLYINTGDLHFENRTQPAGLTTDQWCTGVSVVDINNDGWPDIYVCVSGRTEPARKKGNLLFINQRNGNFKEESAAYGLQFSGYSTQAAFFDYDGDGRLDMYLLNHTLNDNRPNDIRDTAIVPGAIAADILFHNDGIPAGLDHPVYSNASATAGIVEDGNGLGLAISDYNGDGYPDIYVANDYIRNDILWLNDRHGHFSNMIRSAIRHQAYSSMGTDAADINNDGRTDIINLDMQPESNQRKKMMYSFLNDQRRQLETMKGYAPQYIHNMLQVNNGNTTDSSHHVHPFFSETANLAGIAETDWSWSVLMADFNNDGWKDVHITNGMGRDPTNIDFLEYRRKRVVETGVSEQQGQQQKELNDHLASLGPVPLHDYLYEGKNGYVFADKSIEAGFTEEAIANGAVYADLDNDGDLDIVSNNINHTAFVLRNNLSVAKDSTRHTFLSIELQGNSNNRDGIGAKIFAYAGTQLQLLEAFPARGYLSSVDRRLHFGTAVHTGFDSIKVIWPDSNVQRIKKPGLEGFMTIVYERSTPQPAEPSSFSDLVFEDITQKEKVYFHHKETFFFDYSFQPLIPQKYSQEGPFISTGDLNGDGREDFFIGGAFQQPGKVFLQHADGTFSGKDVTSTAKNEEDMQSLLFDADGDHDLDLLIVSGSTEFDVHSSYYQPRLFLNDGHGNFKQDSAAFSPDIRTPGKCVAGADYDNDGDIDLFIGGRVALGTFPAAPRSYLLRNDHGRFTDITNSLCPALQNPGLLNAAVWADINYDHRPDLVIAGDYMPIRIFMNNGNSLQETTDSAGLGSMPGFWRSLAIADIDNDGDLDIVAGNLGLNNPFHISEQQPAELIAKDFDGNGVVEPVFCYYIKDNDGKYQLSAGISRDEWAVQMPSIKKRYVHNNLYAAASMQEMFPKEMLEGSISLPCREVRSGCFINNGKGRFDFQPFPLEAQVAPVNTIAVLDVNGDRRPDIIIAGNEYQAQVNTGRYDASYGLLLTGTLTGFSVVPPMQSGLILNGDTRDIKIINASRQKILLVATNDDSMKAWKINANAWH